MIDLRDSKGFLWTHTDCKLCNKRVKNLVCSYHDNPDKREYNFCRDCVNKCESCHKDNNTILCTSCDRHICKDHGEFIILNIGKLTKDKHRICGLCHNLKSTLNNNKDDERRNIATTLILNHSKSTI